MCVCRVTDLVFLNLSSPPPPCLPPHDSPPALPLCFLIALLSLLSFSCGPSSQLENPNKIRWDAAPRPARRWLFILLSFSLFNFDFPRLVVWDWVGSVERVFHWSTQVQAPDIGEPPRSRALQRGGECLLWPLTSLCKIRVCKRRIFCVRTCFEEKAAAHLATGRIIKFP